MFDAAGAATAAEQHVQPDQPAPDSQPHDTDAWQADAAAAPQAPDAPAADKAPPAAPGLPSDAQPQNQQSYRSVVFVDTSVPDYQTLIKDIAPDAKVVLLDSQKEALGQMADALSGMSDLDSVQVVSHGNEGHLYIAGRSYWADGLANRGQDLQAIGAALKPGGDILFYACNVGAGQAGQEFVQTVHRLTGADVAVSNDETGNAAGQNWTLEVQSGAIEATNPFARSSMDSFAGRLTTVVVTTATGTGAGTLNNAIVNAAAGDVIEFSSTLTSGTVSLGNTTALVAAAAQDFTINGDVDGDGIADITISGDNGDNTTTSSDYRGINFNAAGKTLTVKNLVFERFYTSLGNQGLLMLQNGSLVVDGVTFKNNLSNIIATANTATELTVKNSVFRENSSVVVGTAAFSTIKSLVTGTTTIENSLFADNTYLMNAGTASVSYPGGVIMVQSTTSAFTANIRNVTIANNSYINNDTAAANIQTAAIGTYYGGSTGTATVNVYNTIIAGNSGKLGTTNFSDPNAIIYNSGKITLNTGSNYQGAITGTATFVDSSNATVSLRDYRPASTATTFINAGDSSNTSYYGGSYDIRGIDRIRDGALDLGTYEVHWNAGEPSVDLNGAGTGTGESVNTTTPASGVLIAPDAVLTQTDSDTRLLGATITLSGTLDSAAEVLSMLTASVATAKTYGISVTGNDTSTITLRGAASVAGYQAVIQLIQYKNTAGSATAGTRTATITVNDGETTSTAQVSQITVGAGVPTPSITSATYNASTNQLVVTGTNITDGDSIDVTKLTLTGEGGNSYTLTGDSTVTSTPGSNVFTITLGATDQAFVEGLLNKDGTSSQGATTYNLEAAANWDSTQSAPADTTGNGVTVSSTQKPTITSVTYDQTSGVLTVTGTGMVHQAGSANDIDLTKLTITGQGSGTTPLTGTVEITSATSFTVTLSGAAKTSVDALLNKSGTSSTGGTTYKFTSADDWNGPVFGDISDSTGTGITVTANDPPVIGNLNTDSVVWAGEGQTVLLDAGANATASDTENGAGSWTGSVLTVRRSVSGTATPLSADLFSFNSNATFSESGGSLLDTANSNAVFGTVTNANGTLTVTFNGSATATLIQTVMRNILYRNDTPTGDTVIRYSLTDGNGGSADADVTVTSDTIYVTNTADDAGTGVADGVGLREAVAIALADTTGTQTIKFAGGLASGTITLGSDLAVTENLTFDTDAASGLTIDGSTITVSTGTVLTISNGSGDTLTVSSKISGSGAVTKTGAGTATLSGGNDYSGATTVSAGTLTVNDGIGDNSAVTVASGATLGLSGDETIGSLAGGGTVTLGGNTLTTGGANSSTSFDGAIGGTGSLVKTGTGTLTLTGTNGYTGATTVNAGTLALNSSAGTALADGSAVTVASGATLTLSSASETIGTLTGVSGATLALGGNALTVNQASSRTFSGAITGTSSSSLTLNGATNATTLTLDGTSNSSGFAGGITVTAGTLLVTSDSNLGAGTLTLNGGLLRLSGAVGTIDNAVAIGSSGGTISVAPSGSVTLSGALSGSGNLTKAAGGDLTLSGDNSGFTGAFTISAGTVTVSHANALGDTTKGTTVASGAALALTGGITIAENLTLSGSGVSSGGALVSASGTNTVSGTVTLNDDTTVTTTGDLTLSGVVSGAFNLIKAGSDSLTLSGTNSYTGTTTVSAGTLSISGSGNISAAAVTLAGGTLESTGSSVTLANDITLGTGNGTVSVGSGKALTLSGVISGANTLTKTGSGSLTLSGNNGYSGNTTVSAGTLVAGHNNALGTTTGSTTVSSGATLAIADGISLAEGLTIAGAGVSNAGALQVTSGSATLSGNVAMGANTIVGVSGTGLTLSGTVSGGFNLTKSGSGSLTLSGTNSYTGTTTVGDGALVVTGTLNGSGAGAVTVGSGATLAGTGTVNGGLTIQSGATLAPGVSGTNSGVGTLTVNGGLTIQSGGTLSVDLASSSSFDQVAVTGAVDVGSATLSVAGAYMPTKSASGDSFAIVSNDGSDAVTGTFASLASGAAITLNSGSVTIGYAAGTGSNDIVLTGPVNQAPALGGTAAGPVNDNATATPFSGVTVTDADDSTGTFTVTITYTAANGTLTSANGGLTGTAGNYTLTASSPADLQTLLQALVFTPTANQVTPGSTVQTTFSLTTSDGTSSGTANTGTVITTTSINDAPTDIALSNSSISIFEGTNGVVGTLSATDADTGQTLTYTLVSGTGDTNNALFNISGTSLQANDAATLTGGQSYSVRVQVSDGTATYEKTFTITVTNDLMVDVVAVDSTAPAGTYAADKADGGGLDLREAILLANSMTGSITIRFSSTLEGTIALPSTLTVRSGVTLAMDSDIDGRSITITGNGFTLGNSFGVNVGDGDTLVMNLTLGDNGTDVSALTKSGTGRLILEGTNNTASGNTGLNTISVDAGTLSIDTDANLGTGTLTLSGGNLTVGNNTTIDNAITLSSDASIDTAADVTLSGALSGAGGLTKLNSGTLTLSNGGNSGSFSGTTTVSAGTLSVAADANLGSGAVTLDGGTLGLTGTTTIDNAITLGSSGGTVDASGAATLSGTISGSGTLTKTGGSALTLSGSNSYTGDTTVSTGVLIAGTNSALGTTDGGTTVASGATLRLLGGLTIAENFTISGIGVSAGIGAIKVNDDANGRATTVTGTVTLAANAAIGAYNGTDSLTLSGVVSGAYALTKVGSGALTLSGANSYSGATTVSTGTLIAAHADALGTTGNGTTVTSGAALGLQGGITLAEAVSAAGTGVSGSGAIYNVSGTNTLSGAVTLTAATEIGVNAGGLTMSGNIGGSFGLTKTGTETLTLSGTNGYSTLTVSAGTVGIAADGNLGSGTVSLAAGSKLQVTGATTIDNAVALTGSAAVQTDAAVTISGNITGNSYTLTKSGSGTLTLSGTNNTSGTGVSGIAVTAGTLAVGASNNLGQTTLTLDGGTLASTAAFNSGTDVTLGSGGGTVDVSSGSITLSGTVSGTGGLGITSTNAGNVLGLSGTNTYTGGTTLGSGILQFGNDAAVGTGALTVNGGKVSGSGSTARTIANNLVLGGTMTMSGSAALTFTGTVDLGGATRTVDNTITEALTLSGAVSNGALTVANTGTGALVLGGTNSMTGITVSSGTLSVAAAASLGSGTTTLSGGTLSITGATTIANAIAVSAGSTISNSAAATLSGVLSGSGALTKSGSGTLTLSGTNTHTGTVTISAGTLAASGGSAIGDTSAVTVSSGATLSLTSGNETIGSLAGAGNVVLSYHLTAGGDNSSTTFSGVISSTNSSGLTKAGSGTLTLTGANSYTGSTSVSAGTLAVSGNGTVGNNSAVTVASGATLSSSASSLSLGSLAGAGTVSIGANTLEVGDDNTSTGFSGTLSGSGDFFKRGSGTLTLSGSNSSSFTGTMMVRDGGTLSVAGDANLGTGTVTLNGGTLTVTGAGTIDNDFSTGTSGTATIDTGVAVTLSGAIGGSKGLTKTGSGTLTLSGSSSYSGATTVSAGTLLVTGALGGTSGVTVNSGATLGGTGSIFAASSTNTLTVDSGATLAPGVAGTNNGIGSLTVNGNLSMSGTLAAEIAGTTAGTGYDQVIVSGGVTLASGSSAVTVTRVNSFAAVNAATYKVIDQTGAGTLSSTLSGLAQGDTLSTNGDLYTVDYVGGTGNDLVLTALVNPTVSSVSASTADGSYKAGDTITITVTFSRAVTVTGTPTLALGNNSRSATYAGGSGTTTLSFTYTVQAGDTSADLDYASTAALALSGGTILDSSTSLAAILTLATPGAANSLGANKAIVIDTTAPNAPSAADMTAGTDTGTSSTDNITGNATPTFTGTAEPNSTVRLYDTDGTTLIGTGTADGSGNWSITVSTLSPGNHTITAKATDAAGNVSTASTGLPITIDTTAPATPGTPVLATASDTGTSNSDGITRTTTPTVTGTAEAGSTVTLYDTDGTTVLGTATADGSGNWSITSSALAAGTHSLSVKATDTAGNTSTASSGLPVTIDTTAPTVSSVTSSTANGTYKAGDTVSIQVVFSEAVTVTGTPTLALGTGRSATYASGSGGTTLTFTYVVQAGDTAADLDYASTAALAGTIADIAGNAATLTLPATGSGSSLGGAKDIVIDTTAPTVSAVSAVNGTYRAGEAIDVTVTFTEAVTVTGTPTLAITLDDGTVVQASYLSGSGGTALTFRYIVGAGLVDVDGIGIGASIGGGGIADLIGNGAVRTLNNIAGTGSVRIDSLPPTVTNVTSGTGNGTYTTGETISIQVSFSETVTVSGTPTLALNTGRTATYSGGTGTNTLTFTYTVQAGDTAADLDAVSASALAGSITDAAGNAGVLTLTAPGDVRSLGLNKDIAIDTTAPSIRSIVPPADGTYGVGKTLSFYIQMSEVVVVNGTPTITLDIGGQTRQAVYNPAASVGSVLRFDYVVQAGDADADGIAVTGLNYNGGGITDLARIPLPATLTGLPGLQNVLVDTVAPATPSVPVLAAGQDTGTSATDGLTNISRPTVGGTAEPGATVTVLVDGTAVGTTTAGTDGSWSYSLTTPLAEGTHAIASRATDPAGNSSGTSAALTLTIDATPPVLSTPAVAGGLDNTANVTAATRPTFTGTAEPNSTVTVILDGVVAGTATTGADGSWSFTPASPLADGAHSVATTMTDAAGNIGRSGSLTLTVDTQAPTVSTGAGPTLSAGGTATLGSAISLSDASTLNRVTVSLADARSGDELVIGTLPAGITATRDGTGIVLTGVASAADYQAAVRAIGLRSSAADPSFGGTATSRSIAIQARDIAGNSSAAASVTVTVSRATTTADTNNTTTLPVTSTPVTTSGNGPSQSSSSSTGSSSNGPSSNGSPSNGSTSGAGSSLPSLPGSSNGGSSSGPGTPGSSASTDAGRSVTLNSVGGSSASTDAGRSVTLNSVGGSSASTDAGRSVTLNSIGGGSSGSGGLGGSGLGGSGLGGGLGGGGLGGSLGTGLGGGLGSGGLGGGLGGFGTGGTPGAINTGAGTGLGTGTGTGTGGTTGGQTGQGTPGQTGSQTGPQGTGLNGSQGQQGQGQQGNGAGPGQNRGPTAGQPGTPGGQPTTLAPRGQPQPQSQGQPQAPQGPAAPQDQQGQGQGQPQDTPQDGGGIPADGAGRPADRGADSRAEVMPASPGFARQVAHVHGGPAGAADLLAALASHVLPDSRAA
ncbi:Ig-like domain-containing protein (plasmid) [Azospirillum sp. HJ39]|uniref:Ig-like domain-containing protein n=1 Tax=Azospirillum sp. HJ39 TaxID=3159496 RepID=UPI003557BC1F